MSSVLCVPEPAYDCRQLRYMRTRLKSGSHIFVIEIIGDRNQVQASRELEPALAINLFSVCLLTIIDNYDI